MARLYLIDERTRDDILMADGLDDSLIDDLNEEISALKEEIEELKSEIESLRRQGK